MVKCACFFIHETVYEHGILPKKKRRFHKFSSQNMFEIDSIYEKPLGLDVTSSKKENIVVVINSYFEARTIL